MTKTEDKKPLYSGRSLSTRATYQTPNVEASCSATVAKRRYRKVDSLEEHCAIFEHATRRHGSTTDKPSAHMECTSLSISSPLCPCRACWGVLDDVVSQGHLLLLATTGVVGTEHEQRLCRHRAQRSTEHRSNDPLQIDA